MSLRWWINIIQKTTGFIGSSGHWTSRSPGLHHASTVRESRTAHWSWGQCWRPSGWSFEVLPPSCATIQLSGLYASHSCRLEWRPQNWYKLNFLHKKSLLLHLSNGLPGEKLAADRIYLSPSCRVFLNMAFQVLWHLLTISWQILT